MESSLNSSSPEPTVSGLKSIFNKPTNVSNQDSHAFEVSIDESVTAAPSNKSDLDITSSDANKLFPFKKSRKSTQQDFNVTLDESNLNSVCEQSVTFAKPQPVFAKRKKSLNDFFNVSYNETNGSLLVDTISKSIDESNTFNQTNPFKRVNKSQNELSLRNESSALVSPNEIETNKDVGLDESHRPLSITSMEDEPESSVFVTKENPFKKRNVQDLSKQIEVSFTERNESPEPGNETAPDSRPNDESESDVATKSNPFKPKESSQNNSISVTEERSSMSNVENVVLTDPNQTPRNISLDRSVSKQTNNSTSYLEQSSFNDENLNNWMSDQSDEEMPPPTVPSVTSNLSPTKEKPAASPDPPTETNPLSVWEKKLSEIVSSFERKSQAPKSKINSPQKLKPFTKSDQNVEKPVDVNKRKPLKLAKPAPFATKKLYNYIAKRLEPKYGIDKMLEAENLVISICDTVKKVTRRKTHQKSLIQNLKKEMAKAGLIETTMDFYEFVIKFLPYDFRVKVVPCVQPVTNVVFPPKDGLNPFDKIL